MVWAQGSLEAIGAFVSLGGPVVALLLALSVAALALILLKYWQLLSVGAGRHGGVRRAVDQWQAGHPNRALEVLSGDRSLAGQLTAKAMIARKNQSASLEAKGGLAALERRVEAEALGELQSLKRGFRALETIAQVAPLLGLFGTVLGMIEAFRQLQEAGNSVDPSLLAGGIWVALLTTAVGLGVAMPTSIALTHLESRVDREARALNYALTIVLNPIKLGSTVPPEEPPAAVLLAAERS